MPDPPGQQYIDKYGPRIRDDREFGMKLVGVVNAAEGDQAEALARRRAEIVRDAFISRGVPASRVTIGNVEPGATSSVILRPALDPPE